MSFSIVMHRTIVREIGRQSFNWDGLDIFGSGLLIARFHESGDTCICVWRDVMNMLVIIVDNGQRIPLVLAEIFRLDRDLS